MLNEPIEKDENGEEINPEVQVTVTVLSDGKEEKIYDEAQRKDATDIPVQVSGRGTITIKVFVDDVRKAMEELNLNENNTLNID